MYYTMHVFAYDALTRVTVRLSMKEFDDNGLQQEGYALQRSVEFHGSGEDDPAQWAKDALVALSEVL